MNEALRFADDPDNPIRDGRNGRLYPGARIAARPRAVRYHAILVKSVTDEDWLAICGQAVIDAKQTKDPKTRARAREWLADQLYGDVSKLKVELSGEVGIEQRRIDILALALPVEVRRLILAAMEQAKVEDGS